MSEFSSKSLPNITKPCCFILNLSHETQRFKEASVVLDSMEIPYKRYNAVNGKLHPELVLSLFPNTYSKEKCRKLTLGEMGCILSHIGALRKIVRNNIPYALILEDDVVFDSGFSTVWFKYLQNLLKRYGIVKLQSTIETWTSLNGPGYRLDPSLSVITPLRPSLGAVAYGVSYKGAEKLLKYFKKNMADPYDHLLTEYEWHGVRYAELRPAVANFDRDLQSNINADRTAADLIAQSSLKNVGNSYSYWAIARLRRLVMWLREYLYVYIFQYRRQK